MWRIQAREWTFWIRWHSKFHWKSINPRLLFIDVASCRTVALFRVDYPRFLSNFALNRSVIEGEMTLQWSIIAAVLYVEIAVTFILLLPWIRPSLWVSFTFCWCFGLVAGFLKHYLLVLELGFIQARIAVFQMEQAVQKSVSDGDERVRADLLVRCSVCAVHSVRRLVDFFVDSFSYRITVLRYGFFREECG